MKRIMPKYSERKQNFEDLKERIESVEDLNIKEILINGLLDLKPSEPKKREKDFWDWVSNQIKLKK